MGGIAILTMAAYDRYASIIYGILLKHTNADTARADFFMAEIFCELHSGLQKNNPGESVGLCQLLRLTGKLLAGDGIYLTIDDYRHR